MTWTVILEVTMKSVAAAITLLGFLPTMVGAEEATAIVLIEKADEYVHKSDAMRYNNLSLSEKDARLLFSVERDENLRTIEITMSVKNFSKNKVVQPHIMVIGIDKDERPIWCGQLRTDSVLAEVKSESTATLKGKILVPRGSLGATKKLWVRVVELSGPDAK
jgi:hypothetical protein